MKNLKYIVIVTCFFLVGKVFSQDHSQKIQELSAQLKFKNSASLELKKESFKILDTLAVIIKNSNASYMVKSHSTLRGKQEDNLVKTQKRAEIIKEELINRGVDSTRLIAKGFGETDRIYHTPTRIGDMKNDRIEIVKTE
ncbi:OmpA family protein [Kordia algicida OT-1]|uniref:Peptidoglycan-associated cytoplasmic membrane protein n=1 Tax=Kordia algicida OT-1 TaxID=391587 RepID=A9DWI7_9FLAO|nr:OmpA family protein [Kordia algicida]EDP95912.1 peptidoglycan-associated cytoplasmic membrane protein [Kordia algicida OT-1]